MVGSTRQGGTGKAPQERGKGLYNGRGNVKYTIDGSPLRANPSRRIDSHAAACVHTWRNESPQSKGSRSVCRGREGERTFPIAAQRGQARPEPERADARMTAGKGAFPGNASSSPQCERNPADGQESCITGESSRHQPAVPGKTRSPQGERPRPFANASGEVRPHRAPSGNTETKSGSANT